MRTEFTTSADARAYVANCGIENWQWSGSASAEGFADWLYRHRDGIRDTDDGGNPTGEFSTAMREYLESVGEAPAQYGV